MQKLWPNPAQNPGKIYLITRFGAKKVREMLPPHIAAIQAAGLKVVWICDPCHGNTHVAAGGFKTRDFDLVMSEIRSASIP